MKIDYKKALEMKKAGVRIAQIVEKLEIEATPSSFQRALWDYEHKGIERELVVKVNRPTKREPKTKDKPLEVTREEILDRLKKGATLTDFGGSERVIKAHIEDLVDEGYCIEEINGVYKLVTTVITKENIHKEEWNGQELITFGVVSDTHIGNKHTQMSFLNEAYDIFEKMGIDMVIHCGDISDGVYKNRDEQIYELFAYGADNQVDYIVKNYPRKDNITTHFICGNHDLTHLRNGGVDIGKQIALRRSDMKYLGMNNARLWITPNCDVEINHPGDGSAYAMSYSIQKYIDSMTGGEKPKILLNGHHHKFMYLYYRNIHALEVPSTEAQTPFMKSKRLAAYTGALICKVWVDAEGTIKRFNCELVPLLIPKENDF